MAALLFKNFEAASRKRNIIPFGIFPLGTPIAWIADNANASISTNTATYATTVAFPWDTAPAWKLTLTGNVNSSTITNGGSTTAFNVGDQIQLTIIQDSAGGWYFTMPSTVIMQPGYAVSIVASDVTTLYLQWMTIGSASGWHFICPPVIGPST